MEADVEFAIYDRIDNNINKIRRDSEKNTETLETIADALERIANALEAQQRDAGRNCTLDCFGEGK